MNVEVEMCPEYPGGGVFSSTSLGVVGDADRQVVLRFSSGYIQDRNLSRSTFQILYASVEPFRSPTYVSFANVSRPVLTRGYTCTVHKNHKHTNGRTDPLKRKLSDLLFTYQFPLRSVLLSVSSPIFTGD